MYLKELMLINFRNYIKLELKFNSNLILLTGSNAQGKTNILESIYLSCTGRSYRTPKDKELIRWNEQSCYIKTNVDKASGTSVIEVALNLQNKKAIKINGISAKKIGELMGHLNGVIFSPEDLKLIKDGPIERRRFIDMELSQIRPGYFYNIQQYNRILNQRNNLLKEINIKPALVNTLPIWDEQLASIGASIIKDRHMFIDSLGIVARDIHKRISAGTENLDILYRPSFNYKNVQEDEIRKKFLYNLERKHQEDIKRGTTSIGCHRDDLLFMVNNNDIRTFGSQGQQRTVVLSLKLSEVEIMLKETGEYPVLLLDDVMSELDEYRQSMLIESLDGVQTLITSTNTKEIPISYLNDFETYIVQSGNVSSI